MAVFEFLIGEIASELLKLLFEVSAKAIRCRRTADNMMELIENILPTIMEIQSSGVELSDHRQAQIRMIRETLEKGKKLTEEVLNCIRGNFIRQASLVRQMEKLEEDIASFFKGPMLINILVNVQHIRANSEVLKVQVNKTVDKMKYIAMESVRGGKDDMEMLGDALELAKSQVKKMMFEGEGGVIGIIGVAGIGKTTLAREIERDDEVRCHYGNQILFLTISQDPKFEEITTHMSSFFSGYDTPKLVILDDVWTMEALKRLTPLEIPGCTTLLVSRFELTAPAFTYPMELLNEDDAVSLLCLSAFGQKFIPNVCPRNLVEQVANMYKGLPLALKNTGNSLKDKPAMHWECVLALQNLKTTDASSSGEPVN